MVNDTILVLNLSPNGPSEKKGILAGDKIIQVEDSIVAGKGLDSDDIVELLKGEKGSEVTISVKRPNQVDLKNYTITRDEIPIKSVDAYFMIDDKTGYIKINRFSGETFEEFMSAVKKLQDEHEMEDLVIDLRDNPGGYLRQATQILNQLIPQRNALLVYTEGIHKPKQEYTTQGTKQLNLDDIAVLVDENSASASEILAGVLQDWDRAVIIGRRSFGKGLVQEQYGLSNGAALRLTTAKYYIKSGRLIQKNYDDPEAYRDDEYNRLQSGELQFQDSIRIIDSTEYFTEKGRLVYGGEGIIPDVFVGIDDWVNNSKYVKAISQVTPFLYTQLDNYRGQIVELGKENFINNYTIPSKMIEEFKYHLEKEEILLNQDDWNNMEPIFRNRLKASLGKDILGLDVFFRVRSQADNTLLKAKSIIDNSEKYLEK